MAALLLKGRRRLGGGAVRVAAAHLGIHGGGVVAVAHLGNDIVYIFFLQKI